MVQIVEAVTSTVTAFVDQHGSTAVIGIVAVVGVGIVFKVLMRALSGGGSKQD
jgi:hypothetical protein